MVVSIWDKNHYLLSYGEYKLAQMRKVRLFALAFVSEISAHLRTVSTWALISLTKRPSANSPHLGAYFAYKAIKGDCWFFNIPHLGKFVLSIAPSVLLITLSVYYH